MFQLWLYLLPEQTCSILGDLTTFAGPSKVGLLIIYCYLRKNCTKIWVWSNVLPEQTCLKLGFWPYLPLQANFLKFRVWSHLRPLENLVKVVDFLTLAPWVNMFNAKSLITFAIQTIRFADKHLIILTTPNKRCSDLMLCSHLQRCVNFIKITGLHAFTTGAKLHKTEDLRSHLHSKQR